MQINARFRPADNACSSITRHSISTIANQDAADAKATEGTGEENAGITGATAGRTAECRRDPRFIWYGVSNLESGIKASFFLNVIKM